MDCDVVIPTHGKHFDPLLDAISSVEALTRPKRSEFCFLTMTTSRPPIGKGLLSNTSQLTPGATRSALVFGPLPTAIA